jgi:hypothetical protein
VDLGTLGDRSGILVRPVRGGCGVAGAGQQVLLWFRGKGDRRGWWSSF